MREAGGAIHLRRFHGEELLSTSGGTFGFMIRIQSVWLEAIPRHSMYAIYAYIGVV